MALTTGSSVSSTPISPQFQWINNDADLAQLCQHLAKQPAIAIDTEFVRSRTYYAHIGLLQIADTHGVYLVDPLTLNNTTPLADLLTNANVVKVVHSCSEDLEVFRYAFGVLPVALFDTQIAASFAGYGSSMGYANLLREMRAIDIPKQETRSDWLQRPLSDAQLNYAALDVVYLLDIYQTLVDQLQQLQRLDWVIADCDELIEKVRNTNNEAYYYLRIKSAWKLKPDQLAVLQRLCRWRERQARTQDVPRGRIIKDTSLFDIALKLPLDIKQLKRIQDISFSLVERSGEELLAHIVEALDNMADHPQALAPPLSKTQSQVLKQLKTQVKRVAASLSLPQELLVRKKDYEALLYSKHNSTSGQYQLPSSLMGWRKTVVGDALLDYLQKNH